MKASRNTVAAGVAVFLVGVALRVWAATFGFSGLDSDMSAVGLMAKHVQQGEFSTFHWGQSYGGGHETYLAGLIGFITGTNLLMLQVTTGLLALVVALLIGFIARELSGDRAGFIAASLAWVWSAPFLWWSLKMGGNYWFAMAVALGAVLIFARNRDARGTTKQWILIGVLLGLAIWANPQSGYLAIPAAIRFWKYIARSWRQWPTVLIAGAIAMTPWLVANVNSGWKSFDGYGEYGYTAKTNRSFLTTTLTDFLGLPQSWHYPWSDGWVGVSITVLCIGVAIAVIVRTKSVPYFPLLALLGTTAVYLYTPQAAWIIPRFYVWIFPWIVLVVAHYVAHVRLPRPKVVAAAVLVLASLSTTLGLHTYALPTQGWLAPDALLQRDDSDLLQMLADEDVKYGFADYWLAYRITFETQEERIIAPYTNDRRGQYVGEIIRSGGAAHIFMSESKTLPAFLEFCRELNAQCPVVTRGAFTVVKPDRLITADEFRLPMLKSVGQA